MNGERSSRSGLGVLGRALAWALTAAVALVLLGTVLVPRIAGATPYVVLTGSMQPAFPPGTVVVTRPVTAEEVRIGSVITFQLVSGEPTVVTHRVVGQGISATGEPVFRTRGDANAAADADWVRPVQLRGASWYAVPYVGHLTHRLDGLDRDLLQRAVAAVLLGYAGWQLLGVLRARRRGPGHRRTAVTP